MGLLVHDMFTRLEPAMGYSSELTDPLQKMVLPESQVPWRRQSSSCLLHCGRGRGGVARGKRASTGKGVLCTHGTGCEMSFAWLAKSARNKRVLVPECADE
eukprot:6172691-Pleurochrysis_carterae.AAC.2